MNARSSRRLWRVSIVIAVVTGLVVVPGAAWAVVTSLRTAGSAGTAGPAGPAGPAGNGVQRPVVTGPITGGRHGRPFNASPVPLDLAGYTESEYFVRGTATGYAEVGTWNRDGRWSVRPAETAPYQTRIIVRRPTDPQSFNGTVVVEWLNVSLTVDTDPDFAYANQELLRAGYAWVGVSAQQIGVEGPLGLKAWDPSRYGALSHPGDTFSYDIFSQAAESLLRPIGPAPLGGLHPRALIADGESQSAARMVTYANAIQPVAGLFDGFLIHSRGVTGVPISQPPQPASPMPPVAFTRTDLGVPALTFETETDILALGLGYYAATQPDGRWFRLWEVPGTAHIDSASGGFITSEVARDLPVLPAFKCTSPANTGQETYVMNAAVADLNRWVRTGVAPSPAPHMSIAGTPPMIVRDRFRNALGGIRTPALDVPTSTLTGVDNKSASPGNPLGQFCVLFGTTKPFSLPTITALYPRHEIYAEAVDRSVAHAVARGFLLPVDGLQIDRAAADSTVSAPSGGAG